MRKLAPCHLVKRCTFPTFRDIRSSLCGGDTPDIHQFYSDNYYTFSFVIVFAGSEGLFQQASLSETLLTFWCSIFIPSFVRFKPHWACIGYVANLNNFDCSGAKHKDSLRTWLDGYKYVLTLLPCNLHVASNNLRYLSEGRCYDISFYCSWVYSYYFELSCNWNLLWRWSVSLFNFTAPSSVFELFFVVLLFGCFRIFHKSCRLFARLFGIVQSVLKLLAVMSFSCSIIRKFVKI